ncbi:hypothetical protein AAHA92_30724 [Salvia divinorum]|uniref:Uncharacterized protein n=1 Tax=Salvia divinorum TaxID=28513 RepID=A0ABD1FSB9_SALDI
MNNGGDGKILEWPRRVNVNDYCHRRPAIATAVSSLQIARKQNFEVKLQYLKNEVLHLWTVMVARGALWNFTKLHASRLCITIYFLKTINH